MPDATQAKIAVLNEAFLSLGGQSIQGFDDEVEGVEDIENRYETIVGAVLSHPAFPQTVSRVQLSREAAQAEAGYTYNFVSPLSGDISAIYEDATTQSPYTRYRILDGKVNTDLEAAWAEVLTAANPDAWPKYLRNTIVACLKAEFCVAVTGDSREAERLSRTAYGTPGVDFPNGGLVGDARSRSGQQQGGGQLVFSTDFLTSARCR